MITTHEPMWDLAYQVAAQAYDNPGDRSGVLHLPGHGSAARHGECRACTRWASPHTVADPERETARFRPGMHGGGGASAAG